MSSNYKWKYKLCPSYNVLISNNLNSFGLSGMTVVSEFRIKIFDSKNNVTYNI